MRRGRRRDRSDEPREREFQETLISVYRCSATVKGGRRLSFGSLICVGDGKGRVGIGYGKAKEVPGAFQKAIKSGKRALKRFTIASGGTIPHLVKGRFGASQVVLIPAMPGTGVIAGTAVKAILEAGGLTNVLTKVYGSTNTRNVVKAVMNALEQLRSRETTESLRGIAKPGPEAPEPVKA
jgi:small subunit ribosomal protein S5